MKRILVALAFVIVGAGCGSGGTPVAQTSPPSTPSDTPTASPTPTTTTLTAKDRAYLKELGEEPGAPPYGSDQEAISAAKEFCAALVRGDKKGSIDLQLSASYLALVVNDEAEIDIGAFQHAITFYCPKFQHLIKEYPAP